MAMRIYFVDEWNSSKQNGIGTFRDTLLSTLKKQYGIELFIISLNYDCETLAINKSPWGWDYTLPSIGNGNWRTNGDIIWPFLRQYIEDSSHNIFMFNHSPCADFINAMKKWFPFSRSVFVIHDQGWCAPLLGQRNKFARIVKNNTAESSSNSIIDYYKKELDIYESVDKVVCLSASTEEVLRRIYHINPNKIVRIENGIKRSYSRLTKIRCRQELNLNPDEKIILFVGRPALNKGAAALLDAVQILHKRKIKLRCVFAGNIHGFAELINSHKQLASSITLTGQLTKSELKKWYVAADVGVLPSYSEQCSYAALEMMNADLPIVSSNGNGLRDMFTDGENAFVANILSTKGKAYAANLASSISQALRITAKNASQFIKCNKERLNTIYSNRIMANKYLDLFNRMMTQT